MEEWKDIYFWQNGIEYDYRGKYQVSNFGRVKSLKFGKERILKAGKDTCGYEYIVLYKNGKQKNFQIHRLVAHMFIDGYFNKAEIDHIDTNKQNNNVSNLRWCTSKENSNNELSRKHNSKAHKGKTHSDDTKRKIGESHKGKTLSKEHKRKIGEANRGKPIGRLVARYDLEGNLIDIKYQFEYVQMGFNASHISACCKGKRKIHKGYIFKYHEEVE